MTGYKILHLVRHAQGIHNEERNRRSLLSPQLFDAHLSPLGLNQVDELRHHVRACGIQNRIQLVITSPLTRTMQTAVGVFGGVDEAPSMVGNSNNSAVPSPPFLAVELCRERLGVHPCDKRRSVKEYQSLFPAIDFSLIESDGDNLWNADVSETDEQLAARGLKFMNWLWSRQEKEIAIVTHSGFLLHTLNSYRNDCHPSVRNQICRIFKNCELLSVVIFDTSKFMLGSETNYAIDLLSNRMESCKEGKAHLQKRIH